MDPDVKAGRKVYHPSDDQCRIHSPRPNRLCRTKTYEFRGGFHPGSFRDSLRMLKLRINSRFDFRLSAHARMLLWVKWLRMRTIRKIGAPAVPGRFALHCDGELSRKSALWQRNVWNLVTGEDQRNSHECIGERGARTRHGRPASVRPSCCITTAGDKPAVALRHTDHHAPKILNNTQRS